MSPETPPFIAIEGVPNFRGLGGYPCDEQRDLNAVFNESREPSRTNQSCRIRDGYLFRSAQPTQITPSGIDTLTQVLNIRDVFDFRSETEIDLVKIRYPNSPLQISGTTRYSVPVFKEGNFSPVSLAQKYATSLDVTKEQNHSFREAPSRGLAQAYEDIARKAAETGSFYTILQHMWRNPDRPILFHCTVGKDRTGVFAALIMKLCGVPNEIIIQDYALTTHGLGAWREHLIHRLLQRKEASTREEAESIIASRPESMKYFLEEVVEAKFGGAREYFTRLCGMKTEVLDVLVASLVICERA